METRKGKKESPEERLERLREAGRRGGSASRTPGPGRKPLDWATMTDKQKKNREYYENKKEKMK